MIDPGRIREPITIERRTRESDLAGGFTETWATLATCRAGVKSRPGGEQLEDGRMNARGMNAFTIYREAAPDVAENDRILWNGETWNIRQVHRSGSGVLTVQLDAERGVNGG